MPEVNRPDLSHGKRGAKIAANAIFTPASSVPAGTDLKETYLETSKPAMLQQIGNYDLLVKLAEGGMGSVYKGRNRDTGEIVAIKIVPPATAKNPVLLKRFEQEFQAARAMEHPNVVRAIEYCGTGPSPFLVMEFVDGESLGQRIEREGSIPEEESIRLLAQVCQGLHKAHKNGLIHRDIKPDNIMVTKDGVAKLTDLGLVKDVEGELNLTKTGRGLGTPHFMAPEQFRNAKNADVRCDIYSLGATLYMMITGEVPFGKVGPLDCWMKKIRNDFIPPKRIKPDLSERVDWAIRRSMSGDPDKRPTSCREFIEDLHGQSMRQQIPADGSVPPDVWYLVYKDETGESHTVKGTTDGIRRALKEGLLGDATNIRACRSKQGPFTIVTSFPEFRDLVVEPAPMPSGGSSGNTSTSPAKSNTSNVQPGSWRGPVPNTPQARRDPDAIDFDARNRGKQSSTPEPRPMIPLGNSSARPNTDWTIWLIVLGIALVSAVGVAVLLGKIKF